MSAATLTPDIVDERVYDSAVAQLRTAGVALPTFAELADPSRIAPDILDTLKRTDLDAPSAANLFRVHWHNEAAGDGIRNVPLYLELPGKLTGVDARIVVALGRHFPMIGAHKVLAAYGCLVPRIVTGRFDPAEHRAVWPSTGNYCRGGVAISRIMGCRGVAVLPEGMSRERFDWLQAWSSRPDDIVRTPGSESNVKEIYDKCAELSRDPANVILNQFSEFGNYLVHYLCTGRALERIYEDLRTRDSNLSLAAFVAGTGSAGTLGAGDYLKERHGTRIAAVEPIECPTLLYNGYGEHNIQGIGDKHLPLIHNIMNTDLIVGVSDKSCDDLNVLFNTGVGREYLLDRRQLPAELIELLPALGLSGSANVLAAIKVARRLELGRDQMLVTVATDSAALYASEREKTLAARYPDGFDQVSAAEVFAEHLLGAGTDHVLELDHQTRRRIFNLGYFTWVEQQGIPLAEFDDRKHQRFWTDLHSLLPEWDRLIDEFNARSGVNLPS